MARSSGKQPSSKSVPPKPASWTQQIWNFVCKHWVIITLAIVLLLSSFLRIYQLSNIPPALSQDEVVNGYDAYSLGHTLRDHHGKLLPLTLGSFDDSASVALTYMTIPFVMLGGLTDIMVRMPIALTGIASVLLIYLLLFEVSRNRKLALLGAFILATSPWSVTLTRWAIPPSVVPFFLLLFLWLFARAVKREDQRTRYLILAGIAGGLLAYTYPSAVVLGPLFVFVAGFIFLFKRWKSLLTLYITCGIIVSPLYYLILFQPASNFVRFNSVRLTSTGWEFIKDVATRYAGYYSPDFYFGSNGNNLMMHVPGSGNFYSFLSLFVALAVLVYAAPRIWKASRSGKITLPTVIHKYPGRSKLLLAGLAWAVLAPLPASISVDQEHVTRAIFMFPLATIVITLAIYAVFRVITHPRYRQLTVALFLLVSFHALYKYFHTYTTAYPALAINTQFQYGLKESIQYATTNQKKYDHVVIDNFNQPYIYYLFYSSYDPERLDYTEMNINLNKGVTYVVPQVGKYQFRNPTAEDLKGAKEIKSIEGYGSQVYVIYDNQATSTLIIRKTAIPVSGL